MRSIMIPTLKVMLGERHFSVLLFPIYWRLMESLDGSITMGWILRFITTSTRRYVLTRILLVANGQFHWVAEINLSKAGFDTLWKYIDVPSDVYRHEVGGYKMAILDNQRLSIACKHACKVDDETFWYDGCIILVWKAALNSTYVLHICDKIRFTSLISNPVECVVCSPHRHKMPYI